MNLFDLSGKVAVVIGATGVGGAIARGLAGHGATVAVLGRSQERGRQRIREIEDAGGRAIFVSTDATDPNSLRVAHETIRQELGAADILVNAAGGNQDMVTVTDERCVEQILPDDWRSCFLISISSAVLYCPAKNLALP